jgi:hypothetical protein
MDSFADVIEAFGGPTRFAAVVGIEPAHAQVMKHRDSIPAPYWPQVVMAAKRRRIRGVSLQSLAALARKKRRA